MTAATPATQRSPLAGLSARLHAPHRDTRAHLETLVAETYHAVSTNDISGMDDFVVTLKGIRDRVSATEWRTLIDEVIAPHPLRARLHEEPFTRRAFEKPRGYPGDAPLLDLIYRDVAHSGTLTPLGEKLHNWTGGYQPACRSVQERRHILASLIDYVASERKNPRMMSLACGHLREAQRSMAVQTREVEAFIAIDQDRKSLDVVEREQSAFNVVPVESSVSRFLVAPTAHGTFDLAYAAGLYDYLGDDVAAAVTKAMFDALRPGGLLYVANFAPELRDIAYMEAIMDWMLIYRDEPAVARFASRIPYEQIAESSMARDSGGNVIYLSIRKS
jgi:SAM-dependent methyltransferase